MLSDECIADQVPFDIPENWTWVRLGSVINIVSARRVHKSDWKTAGIPFYRAREIVKLSNREHITDSLFISKDLYDKLKQNGIPQPGDLMVTGVGTIGATYIVKADDLFYYKDASVLCFENRFGISSEYLRILMQTPFMLSQVRQASSGTTVATITIKNAVGFIASIPPLAEQRRIVERVGELMPLVEEYGKFEDAREELDVALPDRLRKSVLQMAVQGKLVSQNPDDEPASALLERIREQRRELIKQKKMKTPKGGESVIFRGSDGRRYEKRIDAKGRESEPACIEDEIPFEIPESWEWARLGSLCDFGKCQNVEYENVAEGVWNLDLEDIEKGSGTILRKKRKTKGEGGSTKHLFASGSVLYSKLRPYLNKVVIADENGVCSSEILPLSFWAINNEYAQLVLMEPGFVNYAKECSYGVKMPRLGIDDGKRWLVAVPPLAEQRRIVVAFRAYTTKML